MFRVIFIGGSDMNGNEQEVTTVSNQVHSASRMKVKKIAFIGLMGAVSAVLMLMRFPIPFMPPFLSFDLSGVMEIMGRSNVWTGRSTVHYRCEDIASACDAGNDVAWYRRTAEFSVKFCLCVAGSVYLSQKEDKKKCCSRNGCQLLCGSSSCSSY